MDKETKSYLKIALAGSLWGMIGIFVQTLRGFGLSAEFVAFSRVFLGFALLAVWFLIKDPSILKIDLKGLISACVIGVISQGLFNLTYFASIQRVGTFTAVVLLYFSPVFMFLLGTFMYKEKADKRKIISVLICFAGCIFGVTGGDFSALKADLPGIALGLIASLSYSLMPALSKKTASSYNPFTIIIYSFMFGSLMLLPFAKPMNELYMLQDLRLVVLLIAFSILVAAMPYCLYIPSLHNVQVSKLGVIASVELIVSIAIAAVFLKEPVRLGNLIGVAIILVSIVAMNKPPVKMIKREISQ